MAGVEGGVSTQWRIEKLTSEYFTLYPTQMLNLSYFSGSGKVSRTGVERGTYNYNYSIFPAGLLLGGTGQVFNYYNLQFLYGVSGAIVHQGGTNKSDTTNAFYFYDQFSVLFSFTYFKKIYFGAGWNRLGVDLLKKSSFRLDYYTIGIGIRLS